jgi:hypothetical protein
MRNSVVKVPMSLDPKQQRYSSFQLQSAKFTVFGDLDMHAVNVG